VILHFLFYQDFVQLVVNTQVMLQFSILILPCYKLENKELLKEDLHQKVKFIFFISAFLLFQYSFYISILNDIIIKIDEIQFVEGNAEMLPFQDNTFDCYTIAFGIRNCTHIDKVLKEAYRVLVPGGRFLCLELSHVPYPVLKEYFYFYFLFSIIYFFQFFNFSIYFPFFSNKKNFIIVDFMIITHFLLSQKLER